MDSNTIPSAEGNGPNCLRAQALAALAATEWPEKLAAVRAIEDDAALDCQRSFEPIAGLPGRPERPHLVAPAEVKHRSMATLEGRAALLHALAHIEFNAVNLALDIIWRFAGMPEAFYRDWLRVAREEAYHFDLLRQRLAALGVAYGDFPAHNGLWDMAERTRGDLLARLALVPRTLEARGLDASPMIRNKLAGAGDKDSAAIVDIILRDEIGHVAIGNYWYKQQCTLAGKEPVACYAELARRYDAPRLRGPFNLEARRAAGFDDAELAALQAG
ncbi:ferritin-like domain-containing protein [Achromobacter seleniivolatilans]|uniref:Ferritin-like domain-containing protein n=1 Tax=Achromobacter seleniivolatilans TaxID=3047478 RepID=A0ABY9MBJ2_9BURK|nr:ferritin-like domain-containing protein [Achromobacter sp. R39]WMD23563.1 ferritin-like domain-containing protein [Achromobacter sp. R39]